MDSRPLVVFTTLAALSGHALAFFDGMLLPHLSQPNTYRRAVYEPYSSPNTGYANSRPVLFQWFPWMNPSQQSAATYETSPSSNPLASFFQGNAWIPPWANNNRQPLAQSSPVSGQVPTTAPQPAVWSPVSLLPWNSGNQGAQPGPIVSFFQNPTANLFPWNRPVAPLGTAVPANAGVAYETSLLSPAGMSSAGLPALQVMRPLSTADPHKASIASSSSASSPSLESSLPVMASSSMLGPQKLTTVEEDGTPMTAMLVEDAVVQQLPAEDANTIRGMAVQPCQ